MQSTTRLIESAISGSNWEENGILAAGRIKPGRDKGHEQMPVWKCPDEFGIVKGQKTVQAVGHKDWTVKSEYRYS
jgi:hypothetical protein